MSETIKNLEPFAKILQRAAERKGGEDHLMELAGHSFDDEVVRQIPDDRWLAAFTKQVFQSGFVWRVIEDKWPGFEEVFFGFEVEKILMIPDELWEQKCKDERIVRNAKKVMSIKANAQMIYEISAEHGSFGNFIADWPKDDIIGFWNYLKKHGDRLGGNTGPYALRRMGVNTFIISGDNESYFRACKHIEGGVATKKSQAAMQTCFNRWQQETGLDYTQISRILSYSVGDNRVGIISGVTGD